MPDTCVNHVCGAPAPAAQGTPCSTNGEACDGAGACVHAVVVVRVGDGTGALSGTSAPVFLDEYFLKSSTAPVKTLALPTSASGANAPFSMSGSATSEGAVARSADEHYVTVAGYAAPPLTLSIATSTNVNRAAGRIDKNFIADTSTQLTTGLLGNNARSAVTLDGTGIWIAGPGPSGNPSAGGVWYAPFGTVGAEVQLIGQTPPADAGAPNSPSNTRVVNIFGNELFVSSASGNNVGVNAIGTTASATPPPTTGNGVSATFLAVTTPPGTGANPSPYAFALLDLDSTVAGLDTLYLADDRSMSNGGGIVKFKLGASGWTVLSTINQGITVGCRGVTAWVSGTSVVLVATTTNGQLVTATDDGTTAPTFTLVASAATNTAFRGVAPAPH